MEYELKVFSEARGVELLRRDAASIEAARSAVENGGFAVLSARATAPDASAEHTSGAGGGKDFPLLLFSRELLALLGAGLPLLEALETLAEKEPAAAVRRVIDGIAERLRTGLPLSLALGDFGATFPPLYVAGISASERSGAIPDALRRYIAYQEQVDAVRRKVGTAMIYPAVLVVAGGLVVVFLMGYVVPRFSRIYSDRMTELPWLSRLLLEWGRFIDANTLPVLAALALLLAFAWQARPRSGLSGLGEALAGHIPVAAAQLRLFQLTRLYRSLGMLLRGGIPVSAALDLVPGLLAPELRQRLALATAAIREGQPLSLALTANGLATGVASRLLRVGERSGQMPDMLDNIAAFHEDEIARRIDLLTRTVEPALMLFIGLAIGVIVVLMYLPIFELAGSFGS
jgi:general secretion pathway protein F